MNELYHELVLISQGSQVAFNGFISRFSNTLYCHAYGILGCREMAEEVVSDAFLEAWRMRKKLTQLQNVRAWLTRIVYNKSVDYLRRERNRVKQISVEHFGMGDFAFPDMQTPADTLISAEELASINAAIDTLPPKCKYVFLAKVEKMPYQDIANMLGIALATVNYHVGLAVQTLRQMLRGCAKRSVSNAKNE